MLPSRLSSLRRTTWKAAWRRLPKPRLFEVVTALSVAAQLGLLAGAGLQVGWEVIRYTIPKLAPGLAIALAYGPPLQVAWHLVRRQPVVPYLRGLRSWRWWLLELRIWVTLIALAHGYIWLKVSIPLLNTRIWDSELLRLDAWLHFGVSPSAAATALLDGHHLLLNATDWWYAKWLFTSLLGLGFFTAGLEHRLRRGFVLSHVLLWTLGVWLYLGLPALGPIYVQQSQWADVIDDMPRNHQTQDELWANYSIMLRGRDGQPIERLNPTRGIAAMPSLHVGVHWLLTLWAGRLWRWLYLPGIAATTITLLGSVITGWHYAVDGYVGLLLATLAYWLAVRVERPPPSEAPQPAERPDASAAEPEPA